MKCMIINGPNLNLIGSRESDIYGSKDFETYLEELRKLFPAIKIDYFQSNVEGLIVDEVQRCDGKYDGIILNAGAYTHTSIAIRDAIAAIKTSVVEVHISNIMNREEFREKSMMSAVCAGIISGFGLRSYELALQYFLRRKDQR